MAFRLAANLSFLFKDVDLPDRFSAAAACGFQGVEFGAEVPASWTKEQLLEAKERAEVTVVTLCAPMGGPGDKGLAAVPGREEDFKASLATGIAYAKTLDCNMVHVLAGTFPEDPLANAVLRAEAEMTYKESLQFAALECAKEGITVLIEPITTIPNYFLRHQQQAVDILEEVGCSNIKLEFDTYHAQSNGGNLCAFLSTNMKHIGHIQVSQVPGRHEPDDNGEINFPFLFHTLTSSGYTGWLGCEYAPRGKTEDGLIWAKDFLRRN